MFILNIPVLKDGDIILTAEKSWISKTVRLATNSSFSHAMLHVGMGSLIHSDKLGVHTKNAQRCLFDKESKVKVLRVKKSSFLQDACMFARNQIGTQYALKDAIRTKSLPRQKEADNKQFCSRLVAQAFESAGLPLVKDSAFCTPQELADSEYTATVNNGVKKATQQEIDFASTTDPIAEQTRKTNKILDGIRSLTGNNSIQSLNDVTDFILKNHCYDESISMIFERSGYLEAWKLERKENEWRYIGEEFMKVPLPPAELVELARIEMIMGVKELERFNHAMEQFFYMRETTQLKYAGIQFDLCKNMVVQRLDQIFAAKLVLENFNMPLPVNLEDLKNIESLYLT